MTKLWVTKPGDEGRLGGLDAERDRLQEELNQIEALGDVSACRICGTQGKLTVEHAPSKKAGNQGKMVRGVIDDESSLGSGIVAWKTEPVRGATFETLCAPCNNRTGSWYNPAYVAFAEICRPLASAKTAGRLNSFSVALHRQRIVKQALASLIATSQPGLTARYPHLRTLLVEKEDRRPLAPVQLWLYLRANPGGMFTGLTIALRIERQQGRLVGGFSFWPLGWLMTIGDVMVEGATNVSGWTDLDYHDKSVATIEIPCEWAVSTYPGDFRSPEQIAAEAWTVRPAP